MQGIDKLNDQLVQQTINRGCDDSLLTTKQAAAIVGMTERGLEEFRRKGGGPQYVRLSARLIRYRLPDLHSWIEANIKSSTAQY